MDTIFVLNTNRQVIDVLSNNGSNPSAPFFGDTYTSELDTGAESYEFTTINNARTNVTLEVGNYVLFKYNGKYKLFQIMETTDEHSEGKKLLTVYAEMAGMELRNDYCEPFTLEGNFINLLERVLQDTNWRVGTYSESLLYNIQSISYTEPKNVYSIIQENLATFGGVEIEFRVEFIGNQLAALLIDCYESGTRGNKKYRRFEYGKDVKGITRERNINDLATAVIGQGNNNLTFKDVEWSKNLGNPCDKPLQQNFVVDIDANDLWNNGGKYIKTVHKVDTDDAQTLLQECWDYLQEIKQPKFDYDVDLALVAEDYQDIGVGDTNYVLDFDYQPAILLEARVGKLELSFADPRDNKCTLTNYKELVSILQQPVDLNTVGNMIQSKFPIGGEDIAMGAIGEGHIEVTYYQAIKTDIMNATLANVDTLIANKADIEDLSAVNADIENLRANKADVTDLNAANGNITNLTSQVGQIETIINGHFTGTDAQILNITAENTTFDNAVIKNAMIDTVSADKMNTGTLNTNNVNIESEDGGIKISGATQQFKDKEGHIRVQIGKDAQGNFTFCLFSQDGTGILLDETGIKTGAVPNGLIVNDMVSDTANIAGSKLDISSVITSINNNTTSIKSSVIKFDDTGQTLQVAFNELKTKVDTIDEVVIGGDLSSVIEQVTTNTTNIGVMQGQISSLIANTTITKEDGTVVQLKDEYNSTKDTVNSHTTKIGSLETNYNKVSGDLASVTSKQTALEQNLDGFKTTVSNTYTTKTEFDNLSIGGRNLLRNTDLVKSDSYTGNNTSLTTPIKWRNAGVSDGSNITRTRYQITDNNYIKNEMYGIKFTIGSKMDSPTIAQDNVTMVHNETYTMSCYAKALSGSNYKLIFQYGSSGSIKQYVTISTEWKQYSWTFKYDKSKFNDNLQTKIIFGVQGDSTEVSICGMKLETGNKATDWTPAPEDQEEYTNSSVANSEKTLNANIDSAVDKAKSDTLAEVNDKYANKTDYEEFKRTTSSSIEQTNNAVTVKFNNAIETAQSISGELTKFKHSVTTNINMNEDGISIGKSNSPFSVNISNDKMSFKEEGTEVAYISNKEMRITDAVVENSMVLGNFKFIPRITGNTSLIWDDMGNMCNYDTSYCNATNNNYPTTDIYFREKPVPGELYTIEICASLGAGLNNWGVYNTNGSVHVDSIEYWRFANGIAKKSFIWVDSNTYDGNTYTGDNTHMLLYAMPYRAEGRPASTVTYAKLFKGDALWKDNGNLLRFNNIFDYPKGTTNAGLYLLADSDDFYVYTKMYCYLEAGVEYRFSCDVDGGEGNWGGDTSTDTVQAYLMNQDNPDNWIYKEINPTSTFTVDASTRWWLRLDVNKNGCSHWFSNIWITKA